MARRRLKDRNIRNLGKIGNGSYMVTLPIEYVRELKWQDNQKVTVELDKKSKKLVIKDWKK
jgi:antitoxin component of MazEF toxin-antitoxin module